MKDLKGVVIAFFAEVPIAWTLLWRQVRPVRTDLANGGIGRLSHCDKAAFKHINSISIDKHHASFTRMVCDPD